MLTKGSSTAPESVSMARCITQGLLDPGRPCGNVTSDMQAGWRLGYYLGCNIGRNRFCRKNCAGGISGHHHHEVVYYIRVLWIGPGCLRARPDAVIGDAGLKTSSRGHLQPCIQRSHTPLSRSPTAKTFAYRPSTQPPISVVT